MTLILGPVTTIDWLVLVLYVAAVLGIGACAAGRRRLLRDAGLHGAAAEGETEEYFVGGRRLRWWAVGFSIIATSFSAASILGVPGLAYAGDFWYLQYSLGDLLGAIVVCLLFIPFFHRAPLTTAYEYLEKRFDLKTRLLGSTLFLGTSLLRAGSLLYGAAILLGTVAPIDLVPALSPIEEAVVVFGAITILYTAFGGIAAVVWTDVMQFAVMALGVIGSMAVVVHGTPGGWTTALSEASAAGKTQIVHLDPADFGGERSLLTAVFGYGLLAMSVFGTNQQPVQRYLSVSSPNEARRALLLGALSGVVGVALSLLLGAFLFVFYTHHPERLATGLDSGLAAGPLAADQIVPHFLRTEVPPVLTGVFVAAVFAAAMSSLDSALNSFATAGVVDFFERLSHNRPSERAKIRVAKALVVGAGCVAIYVGVASARSEMALIPLMLKLMGYFAGGVLGLFLLGMLCGRSNGTGAFAGALLGTAFVLVMSKDPPFGIPTLYDKIGCEPIPFIWSTAVALPLTLVLGWLISLLGPPPAPEVVEKWVWRAGKRPRVRRGVDHVRHG